MWDVDRGWEVGAARYAVNAVNAVGEGFVGHV